MKYLWCLFLVGFVACGSDHDHEDHSHDEEEHEEEALRVQGFWQASFNGTIGGFQSITNTVWYNYGAAKIISADDSIVITQNASDAFFNPNTFNRIVYIGVEQDSFYYCNDAYAQASAADALAAPSFANKDDLVKGCNGFPWTKLTRQPLPYATKIENFEPGEGAGFNETNKDIVLGPPKGAGLSQGSLDVLSLGKGGVITLSFGNVFINNGEGADFIVFENAFTTNGTSYVELAEVSVSDDCVGFVTFPCNTTTYEGCAGVKPVLAYDANKVLPLDVNLTGGDAFDLTTVNLEKAKCVRIRDLSTATSGNTSGFDLDAIGVINF